MQNKFFKVTHKTQLDITITLTEITDNWMNLLNSVTLK